MPWKEICAMDQRLRLVTDYRSGQWSLAALCRAYGISRPTAYKWIERHKIEEPGGGGLKDRSSAPHGHPKALDAAMSERLEAARRAHMSWGPRKLLAFLAREHPQIESWPAASTVGKLFKDRGLVVARRRRLCATPTALPLTAGDLPNVVWCADFKGWFRTRDAARCEPLTITDQATRFLVCCQGLSNTRVESVKPLFEVAFRQFGLPRVMRTDNGAPFGSAGLLGLSRLAVWWLRLGIVPERIAPGRPDQNGRHERMHRTLKAAIQAQEPAANLRAAQRGLNRFRQEYNEQRPHQALGNRCPAHVYAGSPREFPRRLLPLEYEAGVQVRRVQMHGQIIWHNNQIFLSEVLAGEDVGLLWIDERTLRIRFGALTLADYDTVSGVIRYSDGRKTVRTHPKGRPGRLGKLGEV